MEDHNGQVLSCLKCGKTLVVTTRDAGWTDFGQSWVRKYSRLKCVNCDKFYCYSWFEKLIIENACLEEGELPISFNLPKELLNPSKELDK